MAYGRRLSGRCPRDGGDGMILAYLFGVYELLMWLVFWQQWGAW